MTGEDVPAGIYDYDGAAALLKISVRTLKSLVKERRIGHFRPGGRFVRFRAQHLRDFIDFWSTPALRKSPRGVR